ncbi:polyprenyl synthetase family protein [Dolosigranulum pigrum]|uniref:polyprenyl synthetase family protein n=1 Tax=Dolosigranulum pigrum TaxID=29394 RepID=UPI000DC4CF8B|nr:farnesyl diphosphate synthase [Dolosigranulum pigrum]QTJ54788.1 polyprenyl synthetase family protein [Dolosigranulum pigrum]RAN51825.1 geranyl transferase [Dolosigranulum pigrum]
MFSVFKDKYQSDFESYLAQSVDLTSDTQLEEAMNYALLAPGKRLRPFLLFAVVATLDSTVDMKQVYPVAAALEMIHTYSLIHDDLPAMDDDDLRRGRPAVHKKFSEATAILAGDALLTEAFQQIAVANIPPQQAMDLTCLLASTAGYQGMVGGQQADMNAEEQRVSLEELQSIHLRKTGELLKFACTAGGILTDGSDQTKAYLSELGLRLGLAYQIRDDILDIISSQDELGKPAGSDVAANKSTYPSLLGLEQARKLFEQELQNCRDILLKIKTIHPGLNDGLLDSFIMQLKIKEG